MNNLDKNKLDINAELNRILQEELDNVWAETPIGYNKDNDGYHMGKGLIVPKSTWDKYKKALKTEPKLDAYEFVVRLFKEEYEKFKDEQPR